MNWVHSPFTQQLDDFEGPPVDVECWVGQTTTSQLGDGIRDGGEEGLGVDVHDANPVCECGCERSREL